MELCMTALGPSPRDDTAGTSAGQEEKQSPQHSMQISRQSADSQQASRMPQSRSQGRSQSAHSPEPQQQQQRHESSELQEPHVAQSRTMLHSVRNSQNRQDRMQWTQQSSCAWRGIWEAADLVLPLLFLLPWLARDGCDCNFRWALGPPRAPFPERLALLSSEGWPEPFASSEVQPKGFP